MKNKLGYLLGLAGALLLVAPSSFAVNSLAQEKLYIKNNISNAAIGKVMCSANLGCGSNLLANFYRQHDFTPVWITNDEPSLTAEEFIEVIRAAYQEGLNPNSYHLKQINKLLAAIDNSDDEQKNSQLLAKLDLTLSHAFISYAYDLNYGLIKPKKVFPYWNNVKPPLDLTKLLNTVLENHNPKTALAELAPTYSGYAKLKEKLAEYQKVAVNGGWKPIPKGVTLKLGSSGERVKLLQRRLLISGELDEIDNEGTFDATVQTAVIQFQQNNGLYESGKIDSDTLHALNIPVETRILQLELNMDKMRLLPVQMGKEYILVNLPSYFLEVVKDGRPNLSMEVAVGGPNHPSCILNSKITYLVLNPYWNIPTSIAYSEVLPALYKDPNYLIKKKVQVLQKVAGGDYTEINPATINWLKISMKEFNTYRFRQVPGKLNALGKVKFMFQNSCQIYLHDSIESEIFNVYKRDFSHGCIRLGEPIQLTNYLLNKEQGWSPEKVATILDDEQTKVVMLPEPINIYLTYFTAWVDDNDWVQFRNDIYHLDKLSPYAIYLPPKSEDDSTTD